MREARTPAEVRVGCWCFGYRKPCAYHEGWEDAYNEFLDLLGIPLSGPLGLPGEVGGPVADDDGVDGDQADPQQ